MVAVRFHVGIKFTDMKLNVTDRIRKFLASWREGEGLRWDSPGRGVHGTAPDILSNV